MVEYVESQFTDSGKIGLHVNETENKHNYSADCGVYSTSDDRIIIKIDRYRKCTCVSQGC